MGGSSSNSGSSGSSTSNSNNSSSGSNSSVSECVQEWNVFTFSCVKWEDQLLATTPAVLNRQSRDMFVAGVDRYC